jgi:hypothetical protein
MILCYSESFVTIGAIHSISLPSLRQIGGISAYFFLAYAHIVIPYTVKKVIVFLVPSQDVTNQTLPCREILNYSRPGRVWVVTSRLG